MRNITNRMWLKDLLQKDNPEKILFDVFEENEWDMSKVCERLGISRDLAYRALNKLELRNIYNKKVHPKSFLNNDRASFRLDWTQEIESLSEDELKHFRDNELTNISKGYSRGIAQRRSLDEIYARRGYGFKNPMPKVRVKKAST